MTGTAKRRVGIRGAAVRLDRANVRKPALAGTAHVFGTDGGDPFTTGGGDEVFVRLLAGCFDAHLKAVRECRVAGVCLLIDHDWKQALCGTSDGSLMVWAGAKGLYFSVNPTKKLGRRAIDIVRARRDLRECSVGAYTVLSKTVERPGKLPLMSVHACELREISLCSVGTARYPGTWAIAARNAHASSPHLERGSTMNDTLTPAEARALRALHAAASGRIQTAAVDEGAVRALLAKGLVIRGGGRVLLTAAGRSRATALIAAGSDAERERAAVAWRC